MVFKQTFEEDIVDSTGVVKGGSAPPLLQGRRTLFSISLRDSPRSRSMGYVIPVLIPPVQKFAVYREGRVRVPPFASAATIRRRSSAIRSQIIDEALIRNGRYREGVGHREDHFGGMQPDRLRPDGRRRDRPGSPNRARSHSLRLCTASIASVDVVGLEKLADLQPRHAIARARQRHFIRHEVNSTTNAVLERPRVRKPGAKSFAPRLVRSTRRDDAR